MCGSSPPLTEIYSKAVEDKLFRDDLLLSDLGVSDLPSRRFEVVGATSLCWLQHYVERFCRDLGKPAMGIPEATKERLLSHDWPGNVRELANCLERAVILCDGQELTPDLLGFDRSEKLPPPPSDLDLSGTLGEVSRRAAACAEKEKIRRVLEDAGGNRSDAAEKLQVSGRTLLTKMREYELTGDQ